MTEKSRKVSDRRELAYGESQFRAFSKSVPERAARTLKIFLLEEAVTV